MQYDGDEADEDQNGRIPMVIVGNKLELCDTQSGTISERVVQTSEAREFARKNGRIGYYETSAKTDIGVKEMMDYIMENAYQGRLRRQKQKNEILAQQQPGVMKYFTLKTRINKRSSFPLDPSQHKDDAATAKGGKKPKKKCKC